MLDSSDLIADAIGLLRPRTVVEPGLHASGAWALRFDQFPHVKLGVVARSECWLVLEGQAPVAGRGRLLPAGQTPPPYVLASELSAIPRHAKSVWESATDGAVRIGSEAEEDTYLCGGHFSFEGTNAHGLTDVLPLLGRLFFQEAGRNRATGLFDPVAHEPRP
ncbi:cupin domain-containing protein [Streptomyces malaysiensis]|uniref:AraC family transcriptional regulator n=1 Tax=Streptomyces malaysiensis TaxID=92644 RepID=A0A7X5WYG1_STRMQ|nr:cupin domain-containing protein [Streptomyces malaysiensis]NIY63348.1 AraC family transcriptional regulator [Streptomyces malaysiensis]